MHNIALFTCTQSVKKRMHGGDGGMATPRTAGHAVTFRSKRMISFSGYRNEFPGLARLAKSLAAIEP